MQAVKYHMRQFTVETRWLTDAQQYLKRMYFYVPKRSFIYVTSFLMISKKFCDLSLLHWVLFRVQGGIEMWGGGGSEVYK